jgi:hypothetical protein
MRQARFYALDHYELRNLLSKTVILAYYNFKGSSPMTRAQGALFSDEVVGEVTIAALSSNNIAAFPFEKFQIRYATLAFEISYLRA